MRSLQALLALFACAALPLHAAGLDDLTWTTTGGEVTITNCDQAASGELVIPNTIEGNPVTSIGGSTFGGCRSLTRITIPDSVTSIGSYAFHYCRNLTSITIPDGVTSIGYSAFDGCVRLIDITIPEGVTFIGQSAFRDCNRLIDITIPDSVTSIGGSAFSQCTSLTSITIPDGVTSIGGNAFEFCTSLTSITFLGTAPTVGVRAFFGVSEEAQALVSLEFSDSFGGFGSTWQGLPVSSSVPNTIEATIVTGSGSVAGGGSFINGSSVTLTATPAAGQVFIGWSGDASGSENPLTLTVEGDLNIGAIFIEPAAHGLVTQANYDAVVAERDSRFTEDQIHAMSADYTIGLNEAGNVQMKINLFESPDLATFAPLTVSPESVSVVDGSICLEFAPTDDAAFFRFRVQ